MIPRVEPQIEIQPHGTVVISGVRAGYRVQISQYVVLGALALADDIVAGLLIDGSVFTFGYGTVTPATDGPQPSDHVIWFDFGVATEEWRDTTYGLRYRARFGNVWKGVEIYPPC